MTRFIIILFCLTTASAHAETLAVPGGTFAISWHSDFSASEKSMLLNWLSHAAESTALINGRFPTARTNILIQRAKRGKGPVPWANTVRHTDPEGISFHVDPTANLQSFLEDWTATHEFSHLFLPYPGRADIWISEGFASYYQNILMMRKGTLSQQLGWQKLADGFARGAADPNQQVRLDVASREMRKRRAHKRVYWSGAHYFLEAELALQTKGLSMDRVIANFMACCRDRTTDWNGAILADGLDEAASIDFFMPLFDAYEQTIQLPDYRRTLGALGISFNGRQVVLGGSLEQIARRNEISSVRDQSVSAE